MMALAELNRYIEHYLEEDKTHTAIMLTGEWGSGKTYYVEKYLLHSCKRRKRTDVLLFHYMALKLFQI